MHDNRIEIRRNIAGDYRDMKCTQSIDVGNGWSGLAVKAIAGEVYQYRRDVCFKQWKPSWMRQRRREAVN